MGKQKERILIQYDAVWKRECYKWPSFIRKENAILYRVENITL